MTTGNQKHSWLGARGEEVLRESRLLENPYFTSLSEGKMPLEEFQRSQREFYHAVHYFPRPMAALVMRIPEHAERLDILHNIVEEHGDFNVNAFHPVTFSAFLRSIGAMAPLAGPSAAVSAFNNALSGTCLLEPPVVGAACLGIIERAFADISALIGQRVQQLEWASGELHHYTLHAEIDIGHASQLFEAAERLMKTGDEPKAERGLWLGVYLFDRLYSDL